MKSKVYPANTVFKSWSLFFLSNEKSYAIRRWVHFPDGTKKFERLPIEKYRDLLSKPKELQDFVIRLNGKDPSEERALAKAQFKHAYINSELLKDYLENYLSLHIPNKKDAKSLFAYLTKYGLTFFIDKLGLVNPIEWHKQQYVWGKYLLNKEDSNLKDGKRIFKKGEIKSAKVLKYTVNEMNRFIKYLHLKRPLEISILNFEPLTKATLKEHEARRKMGEIYVSKYIPNCDWIKIKTHLEENNTPWRYSVYLAYYYGLRRNEALGVKVDDLKKAYLSVERQLEKVKRNGELEYSPLKSRQPRKVPHWLLKPEMAFEFIQGLHNESFIHPDTLSVKFSELVINIGLDNYSFHDLRRSFITNIVKKEIPAEELRLAVGHSTIQTTYKYYVMDSRELGDEVWKPS